MRRVRVSTRAKRDLAEALRFIAQENPNAARALSRRFDEVLRVLGRFPDAGTIQPNGAERILQAKGTPYRLICRSLDVI